MKLYFKKCILHLMVISILISSFTVFTPIATQAEENSYYARYEGVCTAVNNEQVNCIFTIYELNDETNSFSGHFYMDETNWSLGWFSVPLFFDHDVSGSFTRDTNSYTCGSFTLSFNWGDAVISSIKVYPQEGRAVCDSSVCAYIKDDSFELYGTIEGETNDDDLKLCMRLSKAAYEEKLDNIEKVKKVFGAEKELYTIFSNEFGNNNIITNTLMYALIQEHENEHLEYINVNDEKYDSVLSLNYGDDNKDNSPFTVTRRENDNGTIDIFVIIRGTSEDEWQGNTELTGLTYNSDQEEHDNFYKAEDSIKPAIMTYYTEMRKTYTADKINLIITGHSRGAAVANIYAKEATDVMNSSGTSTDIPKFHNVTAYTFACPNVHKYEDNMEEDYPNIFNYCFFEDIVPTVPLTRPTDGWNYWKYGQTFAFVINEHLDSVADDMYKNLKKCDFYAPKQINDAFSQWKSVDEYYNKPLVGVTMETVNPNLPATAVAKETTIFNILHDATGWFKGTNEKRKAEDKNKFLTRLAVYPDLAPLALTAIDCFNSIGKAHDYESYNYLINMYGKHFWVPITHQMVIQPNFFSQIPVNEQAQTPIYDPDELDWLLNFARSYDNEQKLGWDLSDPASWEGIYWTADGHVYGIELPFKNLQSRLEIARFPYLKYLFVSGNPNMYLAPIYDHLELIVFDGSFCSYDDDTLDIENCPMLEEVRCVGTEVKKVKVKQSPKVKKLNLAENEISEWEFSDDIKPEESNVSGNYLQPNVDPTVVSWINDIEESGGEVEDFPQKVPKSATYNAAEIQAMKEFAQIGNNNEVLGLLDENGEINTQVLQFYALFEYDGNEYRIVSLDIAGFEISGALNLSAFTKLHNLFCENTKLTALDISGCTELETMYCYDAEIATLVLPSNAADASSKLLDVDCEYNYLYTPVFTPEMVTNITSKPDASLEYLRQKGDRSALEAVLEFGKTIKAADYSEISYSVYQTVFERAEKAQGFLLTQTDIDEIVTEVLTAINELEPYLNLKISGNNGTITIVYDDEPQSGITHSLLFGTPVILTATADEGYTFDGWYEKVTQRKFSSNSTYAFKITTNMDLEARFVRTGDVTLTFTNDSEQVVAKIDKSVSEWNEVTGIADLLPEVPYKLGHTNGRWNYTEADVLTALQAGNDVTITPIYDDSTYKYPAVPTPTDNVPVLNLYYSLDANNNVGSFTMAAGISQDLNIEAIGIGFYYKKAASFNPSNFILNINNKMLTSRFDNTDSDGIYIVNINKFTSAYNWCARGYITYYDENDELKTVYSNQINIVNREQMT